MNKYRPAVFIVTYARTKKGIEYVLLKRKLHWTGWEFPKGGIEKNETGEQASKREVKEEVGSKPINIKSWPIKGKYLYRNVKDRPNYIGQTYCLFSAEVKKARIKVDREEHDYGKWVTFKEAIKELTWPNQRKCLRIIDKSLK